MGILDELRQEAAKKVRTTGPRSSAGTTVRPEHFATVRPSIETMYSYFEHFSKECNALEPEAPASYRIGESETLTGLQQRDYRIGWNDVTRACFTLSYFCVGRDPLAVTVSSRSRRQTMQEFLDSHGLRYRIHDLSRSRHAFTIQPLVPVSVRFEPDPQAVAVRMTTRNFDALGESFFGIDAALIDDTFLDELARRLLRKPSRFDELIGNRVPEAIRAQFREKIDARTRAREGLRGTRMRRRNKAKRDKQRASRDGARRDSGARAGSGEGQAAARDEPRADQKTRGPRYAWMVTGDINAGTSSATVGKIGPPGVVGRFTLKDILTEGRHFRMRNQEGQVIYTGYITGEYNGFEPLADYGAARGCLFIEYETNGRWAVPKARNPKR